MNPAFANAVIDDDLWEEIGSVDERLMTHALQLRASALSGSGDNEDGDWADIVSYVKDVVSSDVFRYWFVALGHDDFTAKVEQRQDIVEVG